MRVARSPRCCLSAVLLILFVAHLPLTAQGQAPIGMWEPHTGLREVTGLSRSDSAIWVATSGGVYRYALLSGGIRRFAITDGLHDVNVRAISYDPAGPSVWVGYQDGVIDRLDPETGAVISFQGVARAERFAQRNIYGLQVRGDSLYAATAFGLIVFDTQKGEVRDSYTDLGSLNAGSAVHDLAFAPTPSGEPGLWLATAGGVAYASMQAPNLKDPAVWNVEPMAASANNVIARTIAGFGGALYVGTDLGSGIQRNDYHGGALGLYRRHAGRYERVPRIDSEVKSLFAGGTHLYGTERYRVFEVEGPGQARVFSDESVPRQPSSILAGAGGRLWIGDQEGLVKAQRPAANSKALRVEALIRPNSPYENDISALQTDEQGRLLVGGSNGFYVLGQDNTWTNYVRREREGLAGMKNASFRSVYGQRDGRLWAGSFGGGVATVAPDGTVGFFDEHNSTLGGIPTDNSFVVVGGLDVDRDGRLWVTTERNRDPERALHVRTPDGDWSALPNEVDAGRTYGPLYIDSYGQKWIIATEYGAVSNNDGLIVLDTKDTPTQPDDDTYQLFDQEWSVETRTGLPDVFVNAVTEDRDGVIWVATQNGVARLLNTSVVADDPNAQFVLPQRAHPEAGEDTHLLHGLAVNDIAIDASNRLWAATERGVYQAEEVENSYRIVRHFTVSNAPLPDNSVKSVAVNNQTGVVYFATDKGLVGYQSEAIQPVEQKQDLTVYPNPVRISENGTPDIYIRGLVEETEVRILTPDGRTVARIDGRGGRVQWDGRNQQDELVPSGVYLVVAVGQNGEGAAYGKIAVLH